MPQVSASPIDWSIVISAVVAILGWLYAARRQRNLSRKQHTFNAVLWGSTNDRYIAAMDKIRPRMQAGQPIQVVALDDAEQTAVRFLLNHYEFIAAAIRIGDIDEQLFKWAERSIVVLLFTVFEPYVYTRRSDRNRDTMFEHIEWLKRRWTQTLPWYKRWIEAMRAKPTFGPKRNAD